MEAPPGTAFQRNKGFDMVVLGGGMAGLTAAWTGARLGISVALLEESGLFGGQIATLGEVDDYPLASVASGPDLATALFDEARRSGVAFATASACSVEAADGSLLVRTADWTLRAHSLVVATGARLRMLDVPGATEMVGRGVSQCATCDGGFHRGRDVVVVGGGDAALQEALTLAKLCRHVTVVARGRLRARQAYIDATTRCANLSFAWDSVVEKVLGDGGVDGVRVRDLRTGTVADLACSGVFPFIGSTPDAAFLPPSVSRGANGHVRVDADYRAGPDIYAVGAAREGYGGALVSAAGEGAQAATALAGRLRR